MALVASKELEGARRRALDSIQLAYFLISCAVDKSAELVSRTSSEVRGVPLGDSMIRAGQAAVAQGNRAMSLAGQAREAAHSLSVMVEVPDEQDLR